MSKEIRPSAARHLVPSLQEKEFGATSSAAQSGRYIVLHEYPSPQEERLWRDFLERCECPAHYDTPEYFLEPYWTGQCPFAVLAILGTQVAGVLTGVHEQNRVVSGLATRPQICLDPHMDHTETTGLLADGLVHEAGRAKLIAVHSWGFNPLPGFESRGFQIRQSGEVAILDLTPGAKKIFETFAKNRRRDVHLALRHGIQITEEASEDDLQSYWGVYSEWRKTGRKKIHHNRSFTAIEKVHHMRSNHRRFLARYEGKVIAAAGFRFHPGGLFEYANNCSLDEYLSLLPNDLLVWKSIEWACEHGFQRYSFGGAHPFLRKWASTVIPIYRYRLDRTLMRRYDLQDSLRSKMQILLRNAPRLRKTIKKLTGN